MSRPTGDVVYLAGLLRDLKQRTGLSLVALAAKTPFSKSSWNRYLNGSALPPRQAVADLARLAGEPVPRLLALWEQAEASWSGRATSPPTPAPVRQPRRHPLRRKRWTIALLAAAVPVLVGLPVVLRQLATGPPAYTVGCRGSQCFGADALDMACGLDAVTAADLQDGSTYLELRVSQRCSAVWARVSHSMPTDQVSIVDESGHGHTAVVADATMAAQYVPTRMIAIDHHSHVRACLEHAGENLCTSWKPETGVVIGTG